MITTNYLIILHDYRDKLIKYKNIKLDKLHIVYKYNLFKFKEKLEFKLNVFNLEELVLLYFILYQEYYYEKKNVVKFDFDTIYNNSINIKKPYYIRIDEIIVDIDKSGKFNISIYQDTPFDKFSICNISYNKANRTYYAVNDITYIDYMKQLLRNIVLELSIKILERGDKDEE